MNLDELMALRPGDREATEAHKERMLAEVRAYRLRELRENAGYTQQELAERIGVSQRQVSKIERGDVENAKISTIRKYLEAIGGNLQVSLEMGDIRYRVA